MTNLDAICQQSFDRHHQILASAACRRLVSSSRRDQPAKHAPPHPWRVAVAAWLRRTADRLGPGPQLRRRLTR